MKKHFTLLTIFCVIATFLQAQLPQLSLVQVATGFNKPVDIANCGDERIFIVEKNGLIRIMSKTGVINSTPFLNITSRVQSTGSEQGLLGLAFSPNFKQDGFFYVNYTDTGVISSPTNSSVLTRISRFQVSPTDSNVALPGSEVILLQFPQPYSNHNGGGMQFGPDGYLYVTTGDGGSANDPQNNSQNRNNFLGKILRLDVANQATYAVPANNPFVGQANVRPEIWAYGLRNPWRCSFDRLTGDYWLADVGQNNWEEINYQPANSIGGENYGWRCYEGNNAFNTSGCQPQSSYDFPVFVYNHTNSNCSVTGGYVYRGTQFSSLFGKYIFTDYCSGRFWTLLKTGPNTFDPDTLQTFLTNSYVGFGEDNLGELYVARIGTTTTNGTIFRIAETSNCKPVAFITFKDSVEGCSQVTLTALKGESLFYQWYNSNGPIQGASTNKLDVSSSGWYKVNVFTAFQGCDSFSDSVWVTVKQPSVLTPPSTTAEVCINAGTLNLNPLVSPGGGTYSGTNVVNNSFQPVATGNQNITYNYTNTDGCSSSISFVITVTDSTALNVPNQVVTLCKGSTAYDLSPHVTPTGGTFSGNSVNGTLFDPVTEGTYTIDYEYINAESCTSSTSILIEVDICTNIYNNALNNSVKMFPNPANESFTIQTTKHTAPLQVSVFNTLGQTALYEWIGMDETSKTIQTNQLGNGTYFVRISDTEQNTIATHILVIKQ